MGSDKDAFLAISEYDIKQLIAFVNIDRDDAV